MFNRDDPAHLIGRDHESVVAMLADASVRGDMLQLAESRAMFALVSNRASSVLPPTTARFTASLILGPVAAFAVTVDDIDSALRAAYEWLSARPTFVLRSLGRDLDPLDQKLDDVRTGKIRMEQDQEAALQVLWEERFEEASVLVRMGRTQCRIVACGDMLQIRIQDPDTGRYLTLGHLPFDPDEDRETIAPTPELTA